MLVATAGHIDHGKTSLIRALTGVETDRLPEERARGISIDLGFAYWRPDDGETIGFVDVPGHERFIRNMLAGVGGVDFALLVVAADDGVMPQTIEHVQILDLLAIERAIVAITKCDRVPQERIDAVRSEVQALLARTSLAGAPVFEVSRVNGSGIAAVGDALRGAARAPSPRAEDRNFRLAIDRAFTVTGVGTVVTGTVLGGALEAGARLIVSPAGIEVRVRGLQSAGERATRVRAGERCAVNLAGVDVAEVHRGDWLIVPDMHAPTARIEARLTMLSSRGEPLKHHAPVHLHLGTADITARVLIPGQSSIGPGEEGVAQLALDHRTAAVAGDRFVLRDQSGRVLLGGGRIGDPLVTRERRRQGAREAVSAAMQRAEPAEALAALLAIEGHEVDVSRFERAFNLTPAAAQALYRQLDVVQLGKSRTLALPAARVSAFGEEIKEALAILHRERPEEGGMTTRELRAKLSTPISAEAFAALLRDLAEKRLIEQAGSLIRLAGHSASFSPTEDALWQEALAWVDAHGAAPLTVRELVRELRSSEAAVRALLYRRRASGDLWRVGESKFLTQEQVAGLAAAAAVLAESDGGKGFTAAQYRDAARTGRNWVIELLEFFDTIGVTKRNGNLRTVRPDYERIVGAAPPYVPGD